MPTEYTQLRVCVNISQLTFVDMFPKRLSETWHRRLERNRGKKNSNRSRPQPPSLLDGDPNNTRRKSTPFPPSWTSFDNIWLTGVRSWREAVGGSFLTPNSLLIFINKTPTNPLRRPSPLGTPNSVSLQILCLSLQLWTSLFCCVQFPTLKS